MASYLSTLFSHTCSYMPLFTVSRTPETSRFLSCNNPDVILVASPGCIQSSAGKANILWPYGPQLALKFARGRGGTLATSLSLICILEYRMPNRSSSLSIGVLEGLNLGLG